MKISVSVFFGGRSVEHEVSVISAMQAVAAIDKNKYDVVPVYITKDCEYYTGERFGDIESYKDIPALLQSGVQVSLIRAGGGAALVPRRRKLFKGNDEIHLDVAFPVVHGTNTEDGTLQGLFESVGLPYTGCDILSSAVCMDKAVAKHLLRAHGLPVLPDETLDAAVYNKDPEAALEKLAQAPGYPMVIKPVNLGSSVGISRAADRESLRAALDTAFLYAPRILAERAVAPLREINCAVLGDRNDARASVCEEPAGQDEILSYADKYQSGSSGKKAGMTSLKRRLPAELPEALAGQLQDTAVKAFQALGCAGVVRIDFLLENGVFYINELNTIPGSLAFYLWEASGTSFAALTEELIRLAFARKRNRDGLTFTFASNILNTQSWGGKK